MKKVSLLAFVSALLLVVPCVRAQVGVPRAGTVVGWLKCSAGYGSAKGVNAEGKERLSLCIHTEEYALALFALKDGRRQTLHRSINLPEVRQDEWLHVVFVWSGDGCRFYVNGMPFNAASLYENYRPSAAGHLLDEIVRLDVKPDVTRGFAFERRAWSAKEVVAAYRRACPVDLVMTDSLLRAGETAAATWSIAPGGHFTRPKPAEGLADVTATVEVATSVQRIGADGRTLRPLAGTETPFARYDVTGPIELKTPVRAYEEGRYRLNVRIRRPDGEPYVRNLFFRALAPVDLLKGAQPSQETWRKEKTFFAKDYRVRKDVRWDSGATRAASSPAGAYLEAGPDSGNRFADILTVDPDCVGKPCLVEIAWPDDKPRAMGLFIYEIAANAIRDHLQGGLVTGVEIPNAGTMETRRYLYVPRSTNSLFEARTMIAGRPAAVSRVTVSRLAEPLPVLKVNRPKHGRGRSFGHVDEDQTFQNNITRMGTGAPMDETLRNLIAYFGYTGQSAFHYSFIRYLSDFGPLDGCLTLGGVWPLDQGAWPGIVRELRDNGISVVGLQSLYNAPVVGRRNQIDNTQLERGMLTLGKDGKPLPPGFCSGDAYYNLDSPDYRDELEKAVLPTLAYASACGTVGTTLFLNSSIASPNVYQGAAFGTDDAARRVKTVTDFNRRLVEGIRRAAPDRPVYLEVKGDGRERADRGVDVEALAKIPGVRFVTMRENTGYYFHLFKGAGMAERGELDRLYAPDAPELRKLAALSPGGSLPQVYIEPTYFETFERPLGDDKRFGCYFQNSDMKPHGRWYLKDPAYCLAKADVLNIALGMQPLGSLGNEDETREFVRAYSALPDRPFVTMEGTDDPVVGRYLETEDGTYFYVVNYSMFPVTAVLDAEIPATDLSTDVTSAVRRIALKPFELRSFLSPRRGLRPSLSVADLPADAFAARLADVAKALAVFEREGLDAATARADVGRAKAALADGRLAAAHYWFFTCAVNGLMDRFAQLDSVVAEAKMNRSGRWAVNCGCSAYTTAGGRLFSPDRKWDGETYGYCGDERRICSRDPELVTPGYSLKPVFATETFKVDGYRFKLPKGRYRVRIHAKWGYPSTFNRADFLMCQYWVNGKDVSGPVDFYLRQGKDITKPLVFETTTDVDDVLFVESRPPAGSVAPKETLLFNAIEVERVPENGCTFRSGTTTAVFSGENGALVSLTGADGAERVVPAREAFSLSLLSDAGEETVLASSAFAFSREGNVLRWRRAEGPTVELAVRGAGDEILLKPTVRDWPKGLRLNWIDAPQVEVAEDGALYWPMLDGCEVTDYRTRLDRRSWSYYEPVCWPRRRKGSASLYPGVAQMQFLAHYRDGKGLYFAAHDAAHTQKGVEWERTEEGRVRLSLQTFCGEAKDGAYASAFEYRLRPYAGTWPEACSFYRDWVRTLPAFANPPKRPAWMRESPVVLIYPVKGQGKDNELEMQPNRYYPYVNALAEVEKYGKAFGAKILALLMHWEGTAPWCPPYVWPPYGGEAELAKFRDALHARGDLLGLYCSGTAWTQVSCVDPLYSRSAQFVKEQLWRWMARGPKGEIDAAVCNHVLAQRFGYDLCLTESWSRETLIGEAVKMARFGADYCQFFDQNLGGGAHVCWSADHRHPPVPGAWGTKAMADLQADMIRACRTAGSDMAFGCEGAAATPFVGNLPFNDARSFFASGYGRSVPCVPFVFHEWMCNFSGNQCGSRSDPFFRLAYSFHCGDMMSVVLGADGKIITSWTTPWTEPPPDQAKMIAMVRTFNDLRRKYPEFLYDGRMARPFATVCSEEAPDGTPNGTRRYPSVLSSFWEDGKGGRIGFLTNWRDVPTKVTVVRDGVREELTLAPHETRVILI